MIGHVLNALLQGWSLDNCVDEKSKATIEKMLLEEQYPFVSTDPLYHYQTYYWHIITVDCSYYTCAWVLQHMVLVLLEYIVLRLVKSLGLFST